MNRGIIFTLGASIGALTVAAGWPPMILIMIGAALYFGVEDEMRRP